MNILRQTNNAFSLAIQYFIFAAGIYVLYYFLSSGKIIYIFLSVMIYSLSYLIRKRLSSTKDKPYYSELAMLLISILFTGYLVYLLRLDNGINDYLPTKLLIQSSASFIILVIMRVVSELYDSKTNIVAFVIFMILFFIVMLNEEFINSYSFNHPQIASFIVGSPIIYLLKILTGLPIKLSQDH